MRKGCTLGPIERVYELGKIFKTRPFLFRDEGGISVSDASLLVLVLVTGHQNRVVEKGGGWGVRGKRRERSARRLVERGCSEKNGRVFTAQNQIEESHAAQWGACGCLNLAWVGDE